jgi:hypothetical protein
MSPYRSCRKFVVEIAASWALKRGGASTWRCCLNNGACLQEIHEILDTFDEETSLEYLLNTLIIIIFAFKINRLNYATKPLDIVAGWVETHRYDGSGWPV